jgi:hypothetical protein
MAGWQGAQRVVTQQRRAVGLAASAILLGVFPAGCEALPSSNGTFTRDFKVSGPVRLELNTGSADARVTAGSSGEVQVHGEFTVHPWPWENASKDVNELVQNPPIAQEGNLIRINGGLPRVGNVEIKYRIEVPPETELHAQTGSGALEIRGIRGPLTITSGSGDISASDIAEVVQVGTGSGAIQLANVQAEIHLSTGSGDMELSNIHGGIRARTGSGDVTISQPGGNMTVDTSSGDLTASNVTADLRVRTGSGDVSVDGNPGASTFWDFRTGSGDVALHLPSKASFRLDARSSSGSIDTSIPLVIEGTSSKHALRGKAGDGKARIEVETGSGSIGL